VSDIKTSGRKVAKLIISVVSIQITQPIEP